MNSLQDSMNASRALNRDLQPLSSRPCDEAVQGWGETDRER